MEPPLCPKCTNNVQVTRLSNLYRPLLRKLRIPLPYKRSIDGWLCHECKQFMEVEE